MATIKVTLTEDMLSLISNIHFQELPDTEAKKEKLTWGSDFYSLYGGSFVFEQIAYILGRYDEHIKGTEDDALCPRFPKEFADYM